MNAPRFAKLASTFLAHREMPAASEAMPSDEPSYAQASRETMKSRARAISAIENAIRERAQKKRRVRWMMGGAAMAASVLAIVAAKSLLHHAPSPLVAANNAANDAPSVSVALAHAAGTVAISAQNGSISSSADGSAIAAGSKITTRNGGHAVLALSSGTRIAVDDNSDLAVVEEDAVQIFSLTSGTMRADVAKLLPGQRFVIRTADSEVEVHGTSFSVTVVPQNSIDPSCGNGAATRVVVYEGIVSVRHAGIEDHVPKGNSWPSACASTTTTPNDTPDDTPNAQPDPNATTPALELPDDDTHATDPSPHTQPSHAQAHDKSATHHAPKSSSPLAEQNDIFESGLTAERDGLTNGAISDFERYLSLYPNGPLAEHAAVRRMNLLRTVDHARAVNAARDYLAKYPSGFARNEAQGIVQNNGL